MEKKYIVTSPRVILGLGIQGPITTPIKIDFNNLLRMIRTGYEIYQVNPYDPSEKVRVTISNMHTITFKNTRPQVVKREIENKKNQLIDKRLLVNVVPHTTQTQNDNKPVEEKKDEKKQDNKYNDFKNKNNSTEVEKVTKPDTFTK